MNAGVSLKSAQKAKLRVAKVFGPLVGEDVAVGIMKMKGELFGIKVNLTCDPPEDVELPNEVEGVPIKVEVVGKIRKQK